MKFKEKMQKPTDASESKRDYSYIPVKKRIQLVRMVLKGNIPLKQAVQKLGIKITTARFIINKFRKNGSFPRRKYKRCAKKKYEAPQENINIESSPLISNQQMNGIKVQNEPRVEQQQPFTKGNNMFQYYSAFLIPQCYIYWGWF